MAQLYQRIMEVPGLTGTWQERQAQYYNKLGAPLGGYSGSLEQNLWLLKQLDKPNYGMTSAQSTQSTSNNIPGTNIPVPNARTPFSEVLPYDKVFNKGVVDQLAMEQVAPDLLRERNEALKNLSRTMASTGAWRTGLAEKQSTGMRQDYDRNISEAQSAFSGQINDWLTNWYNQQSENYYKNPGAWKMPTLPSFDEYFSSAGATPDNRVKTPDELTKLFQAGWIAPVYNTQNPYLPTPAVPTRPGGKIGLASAY